MRRATGIAGWLIAVLATGLAAGLLLTRSGPAPRPAVPPPTAPASAGPTQSATVSRLVHRVIDGDSLELTSGEQVRLLGIDAPEADQPGGDVARDFLRHLVEGEEVRLEADQTHQDQYSRLLRYVYLGSVFVNGELVRRGYAIARSYPPNQKHQGKLESLQLKAQQDKRGLWALGVFQTTGAEPVSVSAPAAGDRVASMPAAGEKEVISWRDAAKHCGQIETVEGTIVATYNSGKACFLNFHEDWRRHFTAVIFASDFHKFPPNPEDRYLHKRVRVRGLINEYRGKPEIILRSPDQIEIPAN